MLSGRSITLPELFHKLPFPLIRNISKTLSVFLFENVSYQVFLIICIFIWKCVLSGFPDHLYLYLKIYFFQVFLIMINIVLFSSDGLLLEQPETASAAQTYFLLFLHRWAFFYFPPQVRIFDFPPQVRPFLFSLFWCKHIWRGHLVTLYVISSAIHSLRSFEIFL